MAFAGRIRSDNSRPDIRILLLADTHLGFDMPRKPRIERRRRGEEFFNNYLLALRPAIDMEIDVVVHAGDLFYRSRVGEAVVAKAFEPLLKIADAHWQFQDFPSRGAISGRFFRKY